jgi:hypothetical protein
LGAINAGFSKRPGRTVIASLLRVELSLKGGHQSARLPQEIAERAAACDVEAESQQILSHGIGVDRTQLRIQHDDARREGIQEIGWIEVSE